MGALFSSAAFSSMGLDGASQAPMAFCPEATWVRGSCRLITTAKAVKRWRANRLMGSLE
jgi:hypothetical protein